MIWVQNLSVWVLAPALALVLMAAHELGVRLRREVVRHRSASAALDYQEVGGEYLRSALALMSLLIAFTFGTALERYNVRRDLLEQESLAIGGYYRQVLELREPDRTRLADGLIHYLGARETYSTVHDERELARAARGSEAAGQRLALGVLFAARQNRGPEMEAVLAKADTMLDAATARRNALAARVPAAIIRAVLLFALIAALFLGYGGRPTERILAAPAIQVVMLALAISLILDLDGARSGAIRVDQTPLISVVARVRAFEALRRAAPPEAWLAPNS